MASAPATDKRAPQTRNLDVHRLLDEVFASVVMTDDVQDLKEEMRANLVVRVAELEAGGIAPGEAAERAIAELGDVRAVVDELAHETATGAPRARRRVRPRPSFVVTTVLASVIGAAGLAAVVADVAAGRALTIAGLGGGFAVRVIALAVASLATAVIVTGALRQETTTNYPVPMGRAAGYGLASALAVAGAGGVAYYLPTERAAWLGGGAVLLLVAIASFAYLLATQTNRHKSWVLRDRARYEQASDRFERDPAAAARFGLYTVCIWIIAFALFGVLTFTVGWAWSWLALLGGVAAMMLTLARTLFAPEGESPDAAR